MLTRSGCDTYANFRKENTSHAIVFGEVLWSLGYSLHYLHTVWMQYYPDLSKRGKYKFMDFLFLLLEGDYGLELASLEAFPTQALGCDGRANILFAPTIPFLLHCPLVLGGTILTVAVFLTSFIATSTAVSIHYVEFP